MAHFDPEQSQIECPLHNRFLREKERRDIRDERDERDVVDGLARTNTDNRGIELAIAKTRKPMVLVRSG